MRHGCYIKYFFLLLLLFEVNQTYSQAPGIEELRSAVRNHPQKDTIRINRLNELAIVARHNTPKEAFASANEALNLSQQLGYTYGEGIACLSLGFYHRFRSEHDSALYFTQKAVEIFRQLRDTLQQLPCLYNLAYIYTQKGNLEKTISHSYSGLNLAEKKNSQKWIILFNTQLGNSFLNLGDNNKALQYLNHALDVAQKVGDKDGIAHCGDGLASISEENGKWDQALQYYQTGKQIAIEMGNMSYLNNENLNIADMEERQGRYTEVFPIVYACLELAKKIDAAPGYIAYAHGLLARAHLHAGHPDSAILYARQCLQVNQQLGRKSGSRNISKILAEAFAAKGQFKEAYQYQNLYALYRDSLNERETIRKTTALQYNNDLDKKQSEITLLTKNQELSRQQNRQQKLLLFGTAGGLLLIGFLSLFLWRNNREKQRANSRLQQQQDELKATQGQLIQSEKMASLGELTAGIAHEIQNPLNFVNNFSEVNAELVNEMAEALQKDDKEGAIAIAQDIKENLQKITHHGKRADAIVKGMLQHSRASSNKKEPTDINALADEYLRLSYHGLRAKDKSFNANMQTNFDDKIGTVNIISQDVGRVLLNLFTNAFYSVAEKKKQQIDGYQPTVTVTTKKIIDKISISVKDNGLGIPQKVIDKIYQPFFTTKPAGQGTGLGLSLSYDIITKAHGGKLEVTSKEGEGAEFIISLTA